MEETIAYLNLSPLHVDGLHKRLDSIQKMASLIIEAERTFGKYVEVGKQLCGIMHKLSVSFTNFGNIEGDPNIVSIVELLNSFSETMNTHYDMISTAVISPLTQFINNDVKNAEQLGKQAEKMYDNYHSTFEKYVSLSKKKTSDTEIEEFDMKLMQSHGRAVFADFQLSRQLELVERKKNVEVLTEFIAFLNMLGTTYEQCADFFKGAKDHFNTIRQALPVSTAEIDVYDKNTAIIRKSIESYYQLYWRRIRLEFPGTNSLIHEGYLWKKGSGITKSWQRRYFVCRNYKLYYFHNAEDSKEQLGQLPLLLTSTKSINDPDRRNCFTIISRDKTYTLQALTDWDMKEWMSVINNNIQYLLDHSDAVNTQLPQATSTESDNQMVQKLMRDQVCADCGAHNPSWCCINWGTCICINCSGFHRALTSDISKVRSLTLDHLDDTTLKVLIVIGNANANKILQPNVGPRQITDQATKDERERFIKDKYVNKSFLAPPRKIDYKEAIRMNDINTVFEAICYGLLRNEKTGYGAMHIAGSCASAEVSQLVVLNTPNIDVLDQGGWSGLSYAAYYDNAEAAEVFLAAGCNPNVNEDTHPYKIAILSGKRTIAALFLPYWNHGEIEDNGAHDIKPPVELNMSGVAKTHIKMPRRTTTISLLSAMK
ncbi:ARF GAP-like zinc finger-containing protein [Trichomonas vaginalis G3]|uniref:ARF GAP-like zinc finger-containing protein n=1 Tax=Trichomonas vaginalis (strain ATCC PRA-98 / G3) TaxID=412133 RepID=A2FEY7_TRIV3|nr:GTPase activator protein [Trichomonas vaginalis G3]EAX96541.1 ARF GAP-like zinc finger-containing protein [Trichomonas vaginalis G3]KAI5541091.1 GTPase activator protein [Trichomonas vaginalis G3]|eukprot:XP_001309471.1 ARF GAP-like zinc finger-containing protein [Trichomonas vaginalis G3]